MKPLARALAWVMRNDDLFLRVVYSVTSIFFFAIGLGLLLWFGIEYSDKSTGIIGLVLIGFMSVVGIAMGIYFLGVPLRSPSDNWYKSCRQVVPDGGPDLGAGIFMAIVVFLPAFFLTIALRLFGVRGHDI